MKTKHRDVKEGTEGAESCAYFWTADDEEKGKVAQRRAEPEISTLHRRLQELGCKKSPAATQRVNWIYV